MITTKNLIINGTFRITGGQNIKTMKGHFYVKDNIKPPVINKVGYQQNNEDISITGILGLSGKVTEKQNGQIINVANATILVKQKGYIIDKAKTDDQGDYTIFVKPGIYDIEISNQTYHKTIRNYQIEDGIGFVHSDIVSGEICGRNDDVISFIREDLIVYENWLVNGVILDPRGRPVDGAELVITRDDQVIVHYKTNDDGQYHFLLPFDTYDVRIRLPKEHVKISTNVNFSGVDGFLPKVVANLNR